MQLSSIPEKTELGSLPESLGQRGTVRRSIHNTRWPRGHCCGACGSRSHCRLRTSKLYQCNTCKHQGPASSEQPRMRWVNTMLGDVKRSIDGTYHLIDATHVPR